MVAESSEEKKVSEIKPIIVKYYDVLVLTTNLITTARGVYQHSIGATGGNRHRRFWNTLLCASLAVACTHITAGLPYLTRLEDRYKNTFSI